MQEDQQNLQLLFSGVHPQNSAQIDEDYHKKQQRNLSGAAFLKLQPKKTSN